MLMLLLKILYFILLLYTGLSVFYLLIFAILGIFPWKRKKPMKNKQNKFAVFIPAYKEDNIIYDTTKEILKQEYPVHLFDVIVIADSLQQKTLDDLNLLPIILKEVSFEKSTKAKALNTAMADLPENTYDVALILDSDNILAPDFISKINESFNSGYQVVQGHRAAKNTEGFAILDAISEEVNNQIFSKGHRFIGLASRLAGSGMAISYQTYKNNMKSIDSIAEDKELELKIKKKGYIFEYRDDAICYDEKTASSKTFNHQRTRWITSQYRYIRKDFLSATLLLLTKGNFNYFDKAFQMILPPRLILLGFLFFASLVSLLVSPNLYFFVWFGLFSAFLLSYAISIPKKFYSKQMIIAVMYLPKISLGIVISLFKNKNENKTFNNTEHSIKSKDMDSKNK